MAKRDRSDIFRKRLQDAMSVTGTSRSALARATYVDRSTIGQILKGDMPRMPNAQLAADIASTLGVSSDWLLGLTNRPELPGDIVASAIALSSAERSSADAQLLDWHREAVGSKIRHVPATLPEMLKTPSLLEWEYSSATEALLDQVKFAARAHFDWVISGEADYEIALPVHELEACAAGNGYYKDLERSVRLEQLRFLADHCEQMFPRLRLSLFDARKLFSAPVTVFGNKLAVIYVGRSYLALRERQRVAALTEHFDWLIRETAVDARDVPQFVHSMIDELNEPGNP